jgi:hypothetical protein
VSGYFMHQLKPLLWHSSRTKTVRNISFFNPENVLTPFIARSRQLALHNAERYAVITVGKHGIEFTCEKCPLVPQMFWE